MRSKHHCGNSRQTTFQEFMHKIWRVCWDMHYRGVRPKSFKIRLCASATSFSAMTATATACTRDDNNGNGNDGNDNYDRKG